MGSIETMLSTMLISCALLALTITGHAGMTTGMPPAPHGLILVLYFSKAFGGPHAKSVFGLRIEGPSSIPPRDMPTATSPRKPYPLVDLQVRSASDIRLEVARKLTWDFSRSEFGRSNDHGRSALFEIREFPLLGSARFAVDTRTRDLRTDAMARGDRRQIGSSLPDGIGQPARPSIQ